MFHVLIADISRPSQLQPNEWKHASRQQGVQGETEKPPENVRD